MEKKFSVLGISAFELVAVNSLDSNENSSKNTMTAVYYYFR